MLFQIVLFFCIIFVNSEQSSTSDYNNSDLKRVLFPDSLVVMISACHADGRGSIPRRGVNFLHNFVTLLEVSTI